MSLSYIVSQVAVVSVVTNLRDIDRQAVAICHRYVYIAVCFPKCKINIQLQLTNEGVPLTGMNGLTEFNLLTIGENREAIAIDLQIVLMSFHHSAVLEDDTGCFTLKVFTNNGQNVIDTDLCAFGKLEGNGRILILLCDQFLTDFIGSTNILTVEHMRGLLRPNFAVPALAGHFINVLAVNLAFVLGVEDATLCNDHFFGAKGIIGLQGFRRLGFGGFGIDGGSRLGIGGLILRLSRLSRRLYLRGNTGHQAQQHHCYQQNANQFLHLGSLLLIFLSSSFDKDIYKVNDSGLLENAPKNRLSFTSRSPASSEGDTRKRRARSWSFSF